MSEDDGPLSDLTDRISDEEEGSADPFEETAAKPSADGDEGHGDTPDSAGSDGPDGIDGNESDPDAPLGDLAARVDDRRSDRERADRNELFTEEQVGEIDRESLWKQATSDDPTETVDDAVEDVREISKHSYCQGCEFFSAPPNVHCGHEGTEIREIVDLDRFRVVNCPVVREDERLGKIGTGTDR
ncbi:hypothetical protein [Halostella sp. PRR32]|uniref:hypothetical protein n=1 Tax=Halostella sp. PRR32 TaxID=3098147 RepID=UPI002B1E3098|nr:hypothetical protein [Halostella sp. PRR32]